MATAWNVVLRKWHLKNLPPHAGVGALIACLCVCSSVRAEIVKLADLEARALQQRPEMAAGAARIRQASAEIAAVESTYWPTIAANLDGSVAPGRKLITIPVDGINYQVSGAPTVGEAGAFTPQPRFGGTVAAHGNVYDFGRTRSALDAARAKERASAADARARGQMLVFEVRAAYLRWSVAHAIWEIAREADAAAEARVQRVEGLIAEGAAPPSAATSAQSQINAAATETERAAMELETARLELGFLSARDLGPDAEPDPALLAADGGEGAAGGPSGAGGQPAANGGSPAGAPTAAGSQAGATAAAGSPAGATAAAGTRRPTAARVPADENPQLEALETARAAAEAARQMQARQGAPALTYRVNAGIEAQISNLFPVFGVGVGLTIPLWDGGATSAAEAGARAAEAELAAQLEAERSRDKHTRARRNLQAIHTDRLLALAENALALADTRVRQLQEGPTLGTAEQEALASAEAEVTRTKADLVRARAARAQLQLGLP
jgi:outer membrane protein TolC